VTRKPDTGRRRILLELGAGATGVLVAAAAFFTVSAEAAPAVTATSSGPQVTSRTLHSAPASQVFRGGLYNSPESVASGEAAIFTRSGMKQDAEAASVLASYPTAIWLGDWDTTAKTASVIDAATAGAARTRTTAVFVTYAIPGRDCGSYSAGGLTNTTYNRWTAVIAAHTKNTRSVVLIEPDSLSQLTSCPSVTASRYPLIRQEVHQFAAANVPAYLDGGNSHWNTPTVQAGRLRSALVTGARGFYTNVSNFYPTAEEQAYAEHVSTLTGGAHFILDTSRNGAGWKGTWCNPAGAGLGSPPAVAKNGTHLDALLWVKTPGASDGTCNGGPIAGTWWPTYAAALIHTRAR